ncbi:DUF4282 domain-containing protein [Halopseudomonas xiamenensis]|jgi:hypothetical protein|uniref:DUF4282 domain-containing protein n=1 Tax=Halopseudomonas xiamenensis TaxID=157792 RepID=UPI0016250A1F|nr:DUF4282 domain-containing protein [Halopseudomonas xiamenensis]
MNQIFFFKSMLTPKIITVVYWLLLVGVVFAGLGSMYTGFGGFSFGSFIRGLFYIVIGAVGARIWCELMIVLFKIHENLQKLADRDS